MDKIYGPFPQTVTGDRLSVPPLQSLLTGVILDVALLFSDSSYLLGDGGDKIP